MHHFILLFVLVPLTCNELKGENVVGWTKYIVVSKYEWNDKK